MQLALSGGSVVPVNLLFNDFLTKGCSTTELLTKRLFHLNISQNNLSLGHTRALGSRENKE